MNIISIIIIKEGEKKNKMKKKQIKNKKIIYINIKSNYNKIIKFN